MASGAWQAFLRDGREFVALRSVDVAVHAGEVVAVLGPSGCGKSTCCAS